MPRKQAHKDTSISLHPLSFDEAIKALVEAPKHKDSEAERPDNTKEHVPESAPPIRLGSTPGSLRPHGETPRRFPFPLTLDPLTYIILGSQSWCGRGASM